jgi:hypothetical protein
MKPTLILRFVAAAALVTAVCLIAWGVYGIATLPEADGSGYDPRFLVFDNGYYPVFWGTVLAFAGIGLHVLSKRAGR